MFVGVLRLDLQIPGAVTLKDRRNVVRSFKDRVVSRFRVSVAEVGDLENPRRATLGVSVVSNDKAVCDRVLADVASLAENHRDAILVERAVELVSFGPGGSGIRGAAPELLDEETTTDDVAAAALADLRASGSRPKAGPSARPSNLWTDEDE